ncbi:hypothetical protein LUZ60_013748 [Juncus effusus]|nr:hypothetical protein LUZ60_013748 [Juncus effusus]
MEMAQQQNMEISEVENLDNSSDTPSLRYDPFSKLIDKTKPMKKSNEEEEELQEEPSNCLKDLMLKKLSNLPGEPHKSRPITIYRVPAALRESRKAFYEPKMVSIGPYYHGKEELQAMEEHKWWYFRDFISRNPEIPMETYLLEIRKLETHARLCYSEKVNLDKDEFIMMLLLDGCFILEYFLKYQEKEIDFLCDVGWGGPTIISDLLLLENQIPFFIIHKLASISSNPMKNCVKECELVSDLFSLLPYREMLTSPEISCDKIHHLLHLYYVTMMPKSHNKPLNHEALKRTLSWKWMRHPEESKKTEKSLSVIIPCAAELHESGVKFKRNSSHCLFDIKFKKGILEMPLLVVDNTIRIILTNLVAFEQTQIRKTKIFTSYVVLWNMLVDTSHDVSLLERCGIVELVQHNEAQAADFFNDLAECWSMDYDDHYYAGLFLQLQNFCGSTWNRYRAGLMREYFNNPWSSISVVAAVFLLILTVIQTYYTVYPGGEEICRS